jgi:hypothetical protein
MVVSDGEQPLGLLIVNGNTLDAGGGNTGGLRAAVSSAMVCRTDGGVHAQVGRIANNILQGGTGLARYGFYEDDQAGARTCAPITYENNDIFFPTMASPPTDNAHRQWTSGGVAVPLATVAEVNLLTYAQYNFTDDPGFTADGTYHLDTGSPCIDQGTPTDAPPTDMDGDARPQGGGVDVGADEAN